MTRNASNEPAAGLAAKLQAVWGRQAIVEARPAVLGCGLHLPPFDGIETPDPRRGGWVRMTCRQCGKFLGYAPR
jgi:hypothetical protein